MNERKPWTREETILAFELYCTIPSGKVTVNNPQIIELSRAINRTVNSVKLKLQNFKSYDPMYVANGRIGLSHGSKLDNEVVSEFLNKWDFLVLEADRIKTSSNLVVNQNNPDGRDIIVSQKARIGQAFFRKALLSAYGGKCCVSGLNISELLRASHIKPWSQSNDVNEKTNPQNGLLLNALLDSAFDSGYITINNEYRVVVTSTLEHNNSSELITRFSGAKITLPDKFLPDKRFIEYHNQNIFRG
jgi:putative restriction endonuclease